MVTGTISRYSTLETSKVILRSAHRSRGRVGADSRTADSVKVAEKLAYRIMVNSPPREARWPAWQFMASRPRIASRLMVLVSEMTSRRTNADTRRLGTVVACAIATEIRRQRRRRYVSTTRLVDMPDL